MNLREQLRQMIAGVPEEAEIVLPVPVVRRWLREAAENGGDLSRQKVYTTAEAAELAGVKPSTVAEWAKEGRLSGAWKTGTDGGGEWRIPEGDLLDLIHGSNNGGADRVRFD